MLRDEDHSNFSLHFANLSKMLLQKSHLKYESGLHAYSFSTGKTNMPVPMPEVARPNSTVARPSAQCFATMITAVSEHRPRPTPAASAKLG